MDTTLPATPSTVTRQARQRDRSIPPPPYPTAQPLPEIRTPHESEHPSTSLQRTLHPTLLPSTSQLRGSDPHPHIKIASDSLPEKEPTWNGIDGSTSARMQLAEVGLPNGSRRRRPRTSQKKTQTQVSRAKPQLAPQKTKSMTTTATGDTLMKTTIHIPPTIILHLHPRPRTVLRIERQPKITIRIPRLRPKRESTSICKASPVRSTSLGKRKAREPDGDDNDDC